MVKVIDNMENFKESLKTDQLVVVDAYATWCPPCNYLTPYFQKFSETYSGVTFLKIDVDKSRDIAQHLQVKAMPTIKFFKGGKEVGEVVGADVAGIEKKVKELM
mmetsp:Transcript_3380/g.4989  ORF Transcript_3380/g.4989 Transcript_3380/m.4989 type:complete len:104 (+) Transcript_3380:42-353(+)